MITKMKISVVILALSFWEFYHCYENLCRKNSTTVLQSSTFVNHKAALAIDGDLRTTDRYCSHTDVNQTVAWFQVDLGKPYSISNVTLYYRKDGLGDKDWQPYRFRQFYLDVSDLPASQKTTAHRTRCYTDNTTHPDVLPHVIDIPCKHTARYVIVETTYDAPEDDPVAGAMLEICEIEVSGCETGQYGDDCLPCQRCETCEINSGMCDCLATCINQTCNDTNGHCTFGCATGNWDPKCGSACPANCQDRKCFRENGLCETCKQGYWGNYCNQTCSTFCNENVCSKSDGRCNKGCIMGRYSDFCDKVCSPGCAKGSCDLQSGACSNRCYQHWMGTRCDRCDSTHYGLNCTKKCSVNCTIGCTKDTGVCYSCVEGTFGEHCDKTCGIGCVSGCDQYTGQCVCKLGWQSDRCEDCSPFHYGVDCNRKCSSSCLYGTCYTTNGTCKGGCKCSVVEELSQQVQHLKKANIETILFVVTGLLGLSLVLNLFFILRRVRCKVCENTAQEDSTSLQMISRVSCNETYYLNPIDLLNGDPKEESCICEEDVEGCPQPHYAHIQKTSDIRNDEKTYEKKLQICMKT